jgi:hypothetical protein
VLNIDRGSIKWGLFLSMKLDYSKIVKNNISRRNDILHYQISTQPNTIETNKGKNMHTNKENSLVKL